MNLKNTSLLFSDALGCLVFEEEGVSFDGNQAIKDQQLALQWVYENIQKFGGDKSRVSFLVEHLQFKLNTEKKAFEITVHGTFWYSHIGSSFVLSVELKIKKSSGSI